MRVFFLFLTLLSLTVISQAQNKDAIYTVVDQMPQFQGGPEGLGSFIRSNLSYPREALDNNIQGVVVASFIVEKDGSVSNIEIIKGLGYGCDQEVIRLIRLMPQWTPGKKESMNVRVKLNIPVEFKLR